MSRLSLHRWWRWLLPLAVVLGGATLGWKRYALARSKAQPPRAPPALAVTTVAASRGDIAVNLDPLGPVTPFAPVTVMTRLDGQLMSGNFRAGTMVREGGVLAEIDPRPFQAQLLQAQGQYRRDVASLKGARIDLERYRSLYARDAIQKQQVDDQLATVQQLEGSVELDRGMVESAKVQLVYC